MTATLRTLLSLAVFFTAGVAFAQKPVRERLAPADPHPRAAAPGRGDRASDVLPAAAAAAGEPAAADPGPADAAAEPAAAVQRRRRVRPDRRWARRFRVRRPAGRHPRRAPGLLQAGRRQQP